MSIEVASRCAGAVARYGKSRPGYVVSLSGCAHSSSIDSRSLVFAYHGLGSLLGCLWSIYNVSGASDSPDSASTRPNDLVSCLGANMVGSDGYEVICGDWEVEWVA